MLGIIILRDDIIIYANKKISEIFEYQIEEMLSWQPKEYLKIVNPINRPLVMEQSRKKQQGENGAIVNYEWGAITKTGKPIWLESYSKTVILGGKTADLVTMIDITQRKNSEEEKKKLEVQLQRAQKMEAIGTLAGGVAHDLNNVLAGLVSYPELLLLDIPEDSPLRNSIITIKKSWTS